MGKIFYIIGSSSTGKDTIFKRVSEEFKGKLRTIAMYTTRPIRVGEEEGVSYHFVSETELERIEKAGNLIELRAYDTRHGVWKYFTVKDEHISIEENDYLMIGTLVSYVATKKFFGEGRVLPLLITLDDGVRLQRALDREKSQEQPRFEEMCRRFLSDSQDFSDDNLNQAGIKTEFINNDLEHCIKDILKYIEENRSKNIS